MKKIPFLLSLARVLVNNVILTVAPEVSRSILEVSGKSAVGAEGADFLPLAPKVMAITILRYPQNFPGSFLEVSWKLAYEMWPCVPASWK